MSDLPGFEIAAIGKVESQVAADLCLHTKGEGAAAAESGCKKRGECSPARRCEVDP